MDGRIDNCRVSAQKRVIIPRHTETIVKGQAVFYRFRERPVEELIEMATQSHMLSNGLFVARVMVPHRCQNIPVRVMNPSARDVILPKGANLSEWESVEIMSIDEEKGPVVLKEDTAWKEGLMNGLSEEIDEETREELDKILVEYADCFSKSEFDLGRTTLVKHSINTGDSKPVRQALRRQPLQYLVELDRQLQELSNQKVIEPASSPWASNIVVVAKKDGSLRMCVDYRGLNNVTRKDSYPLPRIAACLDAMKEATFFSTFDLRSGYYQIGMEEEDKDKTAFLT